MLNSRYELYLTQGPEVNKFPAKSCFKEAIQIICETFSALRTFLDTFLDTPLPPPPPMWHFLSTFTIEITNKSCCVTFLLTPLPLKCHILFEWPLRQILEMQ